MGCETFTENVLEYLKGYPDKREIPDIKKIESKYNLEDVVKVTAMYYEVREEELLSRKRSTARQRKMAIYLCKILSGRKNGDIGRIFGISTQAVTNVVSDIERLKEKNKKIASEILSIRESIRS